MRVYFYLKSFFVLLTLKNDLQSTEPTVVCNQRAQFVKLYIIFLLNFDILAYVSFFE